MEAMWENLVFIAVELEHVKIHKRVGWIRGNPVNSQRWARRVLSSLGSDESKVLGITFCRTGWNQIAH
jgi:hypothetical protein